MIPAKFWIGVGSFFLMILGIFGIYQKGKSAGKSEARDYFEEQDETNAESIKSDSYEQKSVEEIRSKQWQK